MAFLEESLNRYDRDVRGYRVTLVKQEYLEGKVQPVERIEASFQEKPFSVLMDWKEGKRLASKTLFVKGANDDKLLAMPAGFLSLVGIQTRDPDSPAARRSSRFPITEFGIKIGSLSTLKAWKAAAEARRPRHPFPWRKAFAGTGRTPLLGAEARRLPRTGRGRHHRIDILLRQRKLAASRLDPHRRERPARRRVLVPRPAS